MIDNRSSVSVEDCGPSNISKLQDLPRNTYSKTPQRMERTQSRNEKNARSVQIANLQPARFYFQCSVPTFIFDKAMFSALSDVVYFFPSSEEMTQASKCTSRHRAKRKRNIHDSHPPRRIQSPAYRCVRSP